MKNQKIIVEELITLLTTGNAHVSSDNALKGVPFDTITKKIPGIAYTLWEVTEHIRIAQWDIVEFCKGPEHESPQWPEGYWPADKHPTEKKWKNCLSQIQSDRGQMIDLLKSTGDKLFDPFPWGSGQSLFREALTLADHNSYHTGEIVVIRRALGIWK